MDLTNTSTTATRNRRCHGEWNIFLFSFFRKTFRCRNSEFEVQCSVALNVLCLLVWAADYWARVLFVDLGREQKNEHFAASCCSCFALTTSVEGPSYGCHLFLTTQQVKKKRTYYSAHHKHKERLLIGDLEKVQQSIDPEYGASLTVASSWSMTRQCLSWP